MCNSESGADQRPEITLLCAGTLNKLNWIEQAYGAKFSIIMSSNKAAN